MISPIVMYVLVLVIFSILIFWKTVLNMIKKKKIFEFLPFFAIAIFICFDAALSFYGLFYSTIWIIMQLLYILIFIWVLMILWGKNGFN